MKKSLFFLLLWLLVVNLFALVAANRFNLKRDTAYAWMHPLSIVQEHSWNPISLHARWDSLYYLDIARHGYYVTPGHPHPNVVFFPLYPLLISIVAMITGGNVALAGWVVSTLALAGAVVVFRQFLRAFHPTIDPDAPIFYLLIFPTAFFLNAVYTEALFLLLSLSTFYFALQGRFARAGIVGLLAALTRVTGVLLFVPAAWELLRRRGRWAIGSGSFLALCLIPLGTALFFGYHYWLFGDGLLFFKVESAFGRAFRLNRGHFLLSSHPSVVNLLLDVAFLGFGTVMAYAAFRRGWTSYGLYMAVTLVVAVSTGSLMSIGRYMLVLFPMYIVLAAIRSEHVARAYVLGSLLLLALNLSLFVNWYWAG
jgi:Mannosyltransferase (PIG-V)